MKKTISSSNQYNDYDYKFEILDNANAANSYCRAALRIKDHQGKQAGLSMAKNSFSKACEKLASIKKASNGSTSTFNPSLENRAKTHGVFYTLACKFGSFSMHEEAVLAYSIAIDFLLTDGVLKYIQAINSNSNSDKKINLTTIEEEINKSINGLKDNDKKKEEFRTEFSKKIENLRRIEKSEHKQDNQKQKTEEKTTQEKKPQDVSTRNHNEDFLKYFNEGFKCYKENNFARAAVAFNLAISEAENFNHQMIDFQLKFNLYLCLKCHAECLYQTSKPAQAFDTYLKALEYLIPSGVYQFLSDGSSITAQKEVDSIIYTCYMILGSNTIDKNKINRLEKVNNDFLNYKYNLSSDEDKTEDGNNKLKITVSKDLNSLSNVEKGNKKALDKSKSATTNGPVKKEKDKNKKAPQNVEEIKRQNDIYKKAAANCSLSIELGNSKKKRKRKNISDKKNTGEGVNTNNLKTPQDNLKNKVDISKKLPLLPKPTQQPPQNTLNPESDKNTSVKDSINTNSTNTKPTNITQTNNPHAFFTPIIPTNTTNKLETKEEKVRVIDYKDIIAKEHQEIFSAVLGHLFKLFSNDSKLSLVLKGDLVMGYVGNNKGHHDIELLINRSLGEIQGYFIQNKLKAEFIEKETLMLCDMVKISNLRYKTPNATNSSLDDHIAESFFTINRPAYRIVSDKDSSSYKLNFIDNYNDLSDIKNKKIKFPKRDTFNCFKYDFMAVFKCMKLIAIDGYTPDKDVNEAMKEVILNIFPDLLKENDRYHNAAKMVCFIINIKDIGNNEINLFFKTLNNMQDIKNGLVLFVEQCFNLHIESLNTTQRRGKTDLTKEIEIAKELQASLKNMRENTSLNENANVTQIRPSP